MAPLFIRRSLLAVGLSIGLLTGLCAKPASASPIWSARAPQPDDRLAETSSKRLERLLSRLLSAATPGLESPAIVVSNDPRISMVSRAGLEPRITVSGQFLKTLTDDELIFSLAHEMAHFALLHHDLIRVQGRGLSAVQDAPVVLSVDQRRDLHHAMEYQADALASVWRQALGVTPASSVDALKKAYGSAAAATPTHPSLQQRAERMGVVIQ